MSPSYSGMRSGYLPDDCSECGACGQPCFGSVGWCQSCLHRKIEIDKKLKAETLEQFMQTETATILWKNKNLYWTDLEHCWVVVHNYGGRELCESLEMAFEILRG